MDKEKQTLGDYMGTLAEDARALIVATSDVAGEKVGEARKRLSAALERSKEVCSQVRDNAIEGVRATDQTVRDHPYQAMGLALAVGVIVGLLATRSGSNDRD